MAKDKILPDSLFRDRHAFFAMALSGVEWKGPPDKLLWE
jgi:hypothetical protein